MLFRSEQTPLLRPTSPERPSQQSQDELLSFPGLAKRPSYTNSHWLAPAEDASGTSRDEAPAQFQENGLLSGVSRTRFRFIYAGILLGYFVSDLVSTYPGMYL